jgi:hypothetical protein
MMTSFTTTTSGAGLGARPVTATLFFFTAMDTAATRAVFGLGAAKRLFTLTFITANAATTRAGFLAGPKHRLLWVACFCVNFFIYEINLMMLQRNQPSHLE